MVLYYLFWLSLMTGPFAPVPFFGTLGFIVWSFTQVKTNLTVRGGRIHFAILSLCLTGMLLPLTAEGLENMSLLVVSFSVVIYTIVFTHWHIAHQPKQTSTTLLDTILWILPLVTVVLSIPFMSKHLTSYVFS